MPKKKGKGRKRPSERSYVRLTRHERQTIERMLDRGRGCREIAREIDRAPSTVANEVERHRFVTSPRARYGEPAPEAAALATACPRLGAWPRCCNGCGHRRAYGCSRRPRVIDELGFLSLDPDGARLLFQVFADAYERQSVIITTNLEFSRWGTVFSDDRMAAAVIDRIVHHGRLVQFRGESYRVRHALM